MVRSLRCLSHLYPLVQYVDALLVFFFQFGLEALILHELQSVHLELVKSVVLYTWWCELASIARWTHGSVADRRGQHAWKPLGLLLLSELTLPRELDVVLIKDYLLDVMGRHLAHEQRLRVALLVALNQLLLEAQELKYLLEHCRLDRSLLLLTLWHL